jgi:hypothetical protein
VIEKWRTTSAASIRVCASTPPSMRSTIASSWSSAASVRRWHSSSTPNALGVAAAGARRFARFGWGCAWTMRAAYDAAGADR